MPTSSPCIRIRLAWSLVALWTAAIFIVIPIARIIQTWVDSQVGRVAFLYTVFACLGVGVVSALAVLRRSPLRISWSQRAWLVLLTAAYAVGAWHLRANPEEAMHFVQYGVLSLLLFWAFRQSRPDAGIYASSFFLGALLGALDEVVQWLVPGRFFDFRDMAINICAVGLMQLALLLGVRPSGIQSTPSFVTLRLAWRFAVVLAVLLMALLAATPVRLNALIQRMGWTWLDEPLVEYGYRITDLELGTMVSRRTADELRLEDAARATAAGPVLAARSDDRHYQEFLRVYSPLSDPFLHELRVHLFRRDRYWNLARAHRSEPAQHRELITIAYREQRMLETYYGATLRASGLDWPPDLRERARQASRDGPYVSPVSSQLITRFRPMHAALILLILLVASRWGIRYARRP